MGLELNAYGLFNWVASQDVQSGRMIVNGFLGIDTSMAINHVRSFHPSEQKSTCCYHAMFFFPVLDDD